MPVQNNEIADVFTQVAELLEIEGANPFRVRAYHNAALRIRSLPHSLSEMIERGEVLTQIEGIGKDLAEKIREVASTGKLEMLEEMKRKQPSGLLQMLRVSGLGPKRVRLLHEQLHLTTLAGLEQAAAQGRIRKLPGFGAKLEQQILKDIPRQQERQARVLLSVAEPVALSLAGYLKKLPGVAEAVAAGSLRRRRETVGDLDILAVCRRSCPVMEHFIRYEDVAKVLARGDTKSTVLLRSGLQVDLRVVPEESYGAALAYFTGSQAHNIALRALGQKQGLKVNEYGVFKGSRRIAGRTEKEIYALLGLAYIEPELREMRGEIEAARGGNLPKLIQLQDLRGDLHAHTFETDGSASLAEMAAAAKTRGYAYLAITDHSQRMTVARGMDPRRLSGQIRAVDDFNARAQGVTLLKGSEVDILENGSLDLPDDILAQLDLTVCSVHSKFNLPAEKQTERIIRAMDNPHFKILGHPTGRLLGEREAYALDVERIVAAAAERGVILELNAHPQRLDLNDVYCKLAKEQGVKLAISTDAHSPSGLDQMRFGIGQARRGWLEARDVVNTRNLKDLRNILKRG